MTQDCVTPNYITFARAKVQSFRCKENEKNAATVSAIAKHLRIGIWVVSAATFIYSRCSLW